MSPILFLILALGGASVPRAFAGERVQVAEVIDGDTIRLVGGRSVRLIGINTPELRGAGGPEAFAVAARDRLADLIGPVPAPVSLVVGAESHDRHGRLLAEVKLPDGRCLQDVLIAEGLGYFIVIPPNVEGWQRRLTAEADARSARRGLWADTDPAALVAADGQAVGNGFRRVMGAITAVGRSHKLIYLDVGTGFTLEIRKQDWARYFTDQPEAWIGRVITARGWAHQYGGKARMRIGHPAMLERDESQYEDGSHGHLPQVPRMAARS